jgi:hypothetical protein
LTMACHSEDGIDLLTHYTASKEQSSTWAFPSRSQTLSRIDSRAEPIAPGRLTSVPEGNSALGLPHMRPGLSAPRSVLSS